MKLNPFIGLKQIKEEEYCHSNSFDLYQRVDELAPSYQEGQTRDMFLFLFFINILTKNKIDFLVKGGIILNMFLGEHARRSEDLDVYVKDPDIFFKEVNNILLKEYDGLSFKPVWVKKRFADKNYYRNTFAFDVNVYHHDEFIKTFTIDGVFSEDYEKMEKVKYLGPKIIDDDFYFYGVDLEYIASEKILSDTSELRRPVKHLIDLYSLINLDLDVDKIKKYVFKSLKEENEVREKLNIPLITNKLVISENKEFGDSYFFTAIDAGYTLSKKEMIAAINDWLNINI